MAKTKESSKDVVVRRLRARLDSKGKPSEEDNVLRAQVDFYAELRDHLAVNEASSGLQAVDALALALIADDDSLPATLTEVVTLLPPPGSFEDGQPPTHALFAPEPDTTIKRPAPRNKAQSKRPAKKRRTTANSLKYSLELPDDVPAAIRRDVDRLIKEAAGRGKTPFRLAYPWSGQRAWYDPQEHPLLHLLHWRFWMKHRATFFICALYAPTGNSDARRKKKSVAVQARLRFISANIEVFGYYSFLAQLEDKAHDTLMWYGGKAVAHSVAAKTQAAQVDLATLYKKDRALYDRTIARALDPFSIDEDGYSSVPELLEQTQALDITRKPHLRLSDVALGRIAMDVASRSPPNPAWVGNKTSGVWKRLLSDRSLREVQTNIVQQQLDGTYEALDDVKPYDVTERGDGDSDFEGEDDDSYSALLPSAPLPARPSLTVSGSDVDEDEEDKVDEADDAADDAEDDEEEAEDREEAAGDEEEAEDGEITESKATSKSNSDASSVDRSHGSGVTSSKKSSGDGEAKKAAAATKKTK
ncbi:hypothetical protein PInf_007678 [Phytophthora infestans]|nr:hypothetical protein PInf_007678 [Phytophthora infestans]